MRATALSLADRKTVFTSRSSASRASSAVMAAPRPWRREDGSTPTPVISATPFTAWQLPAASGPSGPNAAARTECPERSRSRSISIVPPSWSAAILSRSTGPGGNEEHERSVLVGPGPAPWDGVAERVNPLNGLVSSHSSTYLTVPGAPDQPCLPPADARAAEIQVREPGRWGYGAAI